MAVQIVELTGDESRLLKAIERVVAAEEKHRKKLDQTGVAGRQAGDGIAGAMTSAEQVMKKQMGSIVRELRTLGPEGKKAADQLAANFAKGSASGRASLSQISQEYEKASSLLGKHRTRHGKQNAMQQRIAELRRLGPEGKKAADQLSKHLRETGKDGSRSLSQITDELKRIDPAAAKAATQTDDLFGSGAVSKIAKYAAGFVTLTAAIGTVKQAFAFMAEEKSKALDSLMQTTDPEMRLLQVARGNTAEEQNADFEGMIAKADDLSSRFGMDRTAARELVFSARSENFESALDTIGATSRFVDAGSQATAAGQIPGLFSGAISPEQAINGVMKAAETSRLDFQGIVRALPSAVEGGALAGSDFSETAAFMSVLSGQFATGSSAADRFKAFGVRAGITDGFQGLGVRGSIEKLQAMPEEERRNFLKDSQELNAFYLQAIKNLEKIKETEKQIQAAVDATGTGQSVTSLKQGVVAMNPRLQARLEVQSAENRQTINRENRLGTGAAERQAAVANFMADLDENEATGVQKFAAQRSADAAGLLGGNAQVSRLAATAGATAFSNNSLLNLTRFALGGGSEIARVAARSGTSTLATVDTLANEGSGGAGSEFMGAQTLGFLQAIANNTAPGPPNPSAAQRAAIAGDN